MIVNDLDLGSYSPFKTPVKTFHTGLVTFPGGYAVPFGDHADPDEWRLRIWIKAPNAVGQYAAGTQAAAEFLSRQLEELCRNPDLQPLYLQFYAGTGVVALPQNFQQPQDGWYYVTQLSVDYTKSLFGFTVVDFTVQYVSPGSPRAIGMSTSGAALSTGFGGGSTNWAAYPLNATIALADATRTGAEGAVQLSVNPVLNPSPYVPSAAISDWWKGGCHAYDVMAGIGTNAVPLAGLFTNANWIAAFGKDHRFVGDVVLTNGLILWSLALTASPGIVGYAWIAGAWQQFGSLTYNDVAGNAGTVRQVTLQRVSLEEVRADVWLSTSGNKWAKLTMRLQRGADTTRLEFLPLSEANSAQNALTLTLPSAAKITYNSITIADEGIAATNLGATTDFGYAAHLILNGAFPFIPVLLWQDTTTSQPYVASTTLSGIGDTGGPGQNATKAYGVAAFPFATPQNLQSLAGSGTLGTGWTNVADGAQNPASNGTVGQCASGTLTGNADLFGTAWVPPAGAYDIWFRVRVLSNAGSAAEMQLGLWNTTDSVFVGSTTYKANQWLTTYSWLKVAAGVTPTATKSMQFRAVTTATLGTTWLVDEAVMVPITSTTSRSFPQDLAQQFQYDRTTKIRVQ